MASIQTNTYEGRYVRLTVVEESTSIENNTSTIRWTLESIGGESNYYSIYNWGVWINGQEIYSQRTTEWNTYDFPAAKGSTTGTMVIGHNSDGTASPVGFTLKGKVYYKGESTYYGSCGLSTIPRTSPMEMSSYNITTNSSVTLYTNQKSDSFTHTFTYSFGNDSGTIATGVKGSYNWFIPRSLADQIPDSIRGNGTIYCKTYNGSTYIGQSYCNFTLNVDSGIIPTISSSSVYDGNTTVSNKNWGTLLKGLSWLKIDLSGNGLYRSWIRIYNCKYEGTIYSDSTLNNLNYQLRQKGLLVGNRSCELWVTDSRGRESSHIIKNYTVTDYFSPSISKYNAQRCDSNGNIIDDGTYLKVEFVGSAAAVNNKNTFTARVGYKLKGASNYTYTNYINSSTTTHSINKSGTNMAIFGGGNINSSSSYDIIFEVLDAFNSNKRYKEISTGFDLIHFHKSGKSIAFGKKSEASDTESKVEFGMDAVFKKEIFFNGGTLTQLNNLVSLMQNNISLIYKRLATMEDNPIGEYTLFEGNKEFVSDGSSFQYLCTVYSLFTKVIEKFPVKDGYKRTYRLCLEYTDAIYVENGSVYITFVDYPENINRRDYIFPNVWGDASTDVRSYSEMDFDMDEIERALVNENRHHWFLRTTPAFRIGAGYKWRIYRVYLKIYDHLEGTVM